MKRGGNWVGRSLFSGWKRGKAEHAHIIILFVLAHLWSGWYYYASLIASLLVSNFAEGQQWLGGIDKYMNCQTSQPVTVHGLNCHRILPFYHSDECYCGSYIQKMVWQVTLDSLKEAWVKLSWGGMFGLHFGRWINHFEMMRW